MKYSRSPLPGLGLFNPIFQPMGKSFAIQIYTAQGYKIAELSLDDASWKPLS